MVSLTDWFHEYSSTIGQLNHFGTSGQLRGSGGNIYRRDAFKDNGQDKSEISSLKFYSILINGKGRFNETDLLPLQHFFVSNGEVRLFRMVSMAAEFAFEVSIDQHKLTLVATDGHPIQPLEVSH